MACHEGGSNVDWARDEADPAWDEDQLRIYNIRRIQQQLDGLNEYRADGDEDEQDIVERQQLEQ